MNNLSQTVSQRFQVIPLSQTVFESVISSKEDLVKLLERNAVNRVEQMSVLFDFIEANKWSTTFHVKAFWVNYDLNVHMTSSDGLIIGFVDKRPRQEGL